MFQLVWIHENLDKEYCCVLCGVSQKLSHLASHGCIFRHTTHPAGIFLVLQNDYYDIKSVFPLRPGYKAIYRDPDTGKSIVLQNIDDFTGFKRLIYVAPTQSPEPCSITIDTAALEILENRQPQNEERHCCGVCGELCFRKEMPGHVCIIENNADPECRFLIMPEYNQFYPIVENGKEIMIGFEDSGELKYYTSSLDSFSTNQKIFCPLEFETLITPLDHNSDSLENCKTLDDQDYEHNSEDESDQDAQTTSSGKTINYHLDELSKALITEVKQHKYLYEKKGKRDPAHRLAIFVQIGKTILNDKFRTENTNYGLLHHLE